MCWSNSQTVSYNRNDLKYSMDNLHENMEYSHVILDWRRKGYYTRQ